MHYDTIIVGGSFAGLSAALYLARARRSVLVLDTGLPPIASLRPPTAFLPRAGALPGPCSKSCADKWRPIRPCGSAN